MTPDEHKIPDDDTVREAVEMMQNSIYRDNKFIKTLIQAATAQQWQPIETAPKNGTNIIGYYSSPYETYTDVVAYSGLNKQWVGRGYIFRPITHWRPLPKPPKDLK